MSDLENLIAMLQREPDHGSRNAMAIKLAETKRPEVLDALMSLIIKPELANYRGTLVHCLGNFDCKSYFAQLVELVIQGNWEVAHEAFEILKSIEEPSEDQALAAFNSLTTVSATHQLEGWKSALIDDLLSMFD